MHLSYRRKCRVCGGDALTPVIDLGSQSIQGAFVKPGMDEPPTRRVPLALSRCDPTRSQTACGLLQTSVTVPPDILYATYWYRSGTNETMSNHLRGIASEVERLVDSPNPNVLDIGCNDGTLLRFYPRSFRCFGIDPSDAVIGLEQEFEVIRDRFPSAELGPRLQGAQFDAVTSIAMFYDLEEPVAFVSAIKDVLAPGGLWIFEVSYMPLMLEMNSYDTICHEHLEYYSLAVIERVLDGAGMKLFAAELNDINGGSVRCYVTHRENFKFRSDSAERRIREFRRREFDLELDTDKPYRDFQDRVNAHRDELTRLLKDLKRAGKRIHVYGASTKGNTILQFCGIDNSLIDYAADRNPDKHGARTIGTDIPIISEADSRAMHPDFYLVLPWHFKAEFVERERAALESGTQMIFPLPRIEIVTG